MRIQTLKNQSLETTRHSCLVHLFFLLYYCVSIYYRSQLVDICDNDFNSVDNGPRWGSITDKARTLWWNNMTNDSTYQMDNALLISDEPNGIFSDMEIIGRPGSCLCFALLWASTCLYLGKQEDICVQILQGRIMTTKTEITILIGIFCNDSISKLYVKLPHKINPTLMWTCWCDLIQLLWLRPAVDIL